jgi:hypothetical protein
MSVEQDMVECPVCDRKILSDTAKCPGCGQDLSMSSFEELEQVARTLSEDKTIEVDPRAAAPANAGSSKLSESHHEEVQVAEEGDSEDADKKGRFHLFGRKKH